MKGVPMSPKLGNTQQVADYLYPDGGEAALVRVRRLCRAGQLRYVQSGAKGTYWIEWSSVNDFLARALDSFVCGVLRRERAPELRPAPQFFIRHR